MLIISRWSYFLLPLSLPVCYANEGPRFPPVSSKTALTCSGQVYAASTATSHQSSIAFRRWNVSRAREICVLAGAFETTANSLFAATLCRLHLSLPKCLPSTIPKKKKTCKFLRICFDLSFLFSCSPLHFFFYSQFCCLLFRLSFVISQKICLQCCKT